MKEELTPEEKIDKLWKTSRNNGIILTLLIVVVCIIAFPVFLLAPLTGMVYGVALIAAILMIIGCARKTKLGVIAGIVSSIFLILTMGLIEIVLGVLMLLDMIKLLSSLKKNQ